MPADFVTTIDSDDEVSNYGGESSKTTSSKSKKQEDEELDPDFEFDFGGGGSAGIDLWGGDEVRVGDKGKEVCLLCAIRRIRACLTESGYQR
jgi:ATP-dependent RNA helicase DDX27